MFCLRNLAFQPTVKSVNTKIGNELFSKVHYLRPNAPTLSPSVNGSVINISVSFTVVSVQSLFSWRRLRHFQSAFTPFARSFTVNISPILSEKMDCTNPKQVCIIGSGNWGSAIAKIVGGNAVASKNLQNRVTMYVYEELINGKKLTEIINETHENVKYLPGHKLPPNVVAIPDVVEAAKDADVLIFVVPHQFIRTLCSTLLGKIKSTAIALSLIKGFDRAEGGGIDLISHIITRHLKVPCSVLMGANLANEVADEMFCETTIGCKHPTAGPLLREIIQTDYFRVVVVDDEDTVEVCGALKNIVACGAGFVDGLGLGDNTKAAVIRLGLMEMVKFVDVFYPGGKLSTFFESCGVADLITTCYGGRNRKVSEAFVKTGKSIKELEDEMLNGQKLQGPFTAEEVNYMLKNKGMEQQFPLFTAIHKICTGVLTPKDFIDCIRNHPEHIINHIASKK
ncbi:glycerol-3-phosphate dehydrogenase [NAD(+)], cytoplasmic isoform X3 [Euwallacea similis]|uniref:glycerol-3-phosphate dehydrogenase [NAD(+)], cytoplasmic isoform X3 n=1 Tax=Euwallacea similis TaxID=1736056 RepID=UPI00344B8E3F